MSLVSRLTVFTLRGFSTRLTVVLLYVTKQAMAYSLGDQLLKGAFIKRELLKFLFLLDA